MSARGAVRKPKIPVRAVPVISYQPAGRRKRGRGVAFEWPLPAVLRFVDRGIALKQGHRPPPANAYIVGYNRVQLRTLEMVRRWLLKAQREALPIIEVPSRDTRQERYDLGGHVTMAGWFGRFIHDWRHQSIYCPQCRKSYPRGKEKFVILGRCPSGTHGHVRRARAPTGLACPRGHLLMRD